MGPVKRVEHAVASPSIIYVLLVLGLACLAFELTQPGFGFAGFVGVGMLRARRVRDLGGSAVVARGCAAWSAGWG